MTHFIQTQFIIFTIKELYFIVYLTNKKRKTTPMVSCKQIGPLIIPTKYKKTLIQPVYFQFDVKLLSPKNGSKGSFEGQVQFHGSLVNNDVFWRNWVGNVQVWIGSGDFKRCSLSEKLGVNLVRKLPMYLILWYYSRKCSTCLNG